MSNTVYENKKKESEGLNILQVVCLLVGTILGVGVFELPSRIMYIGSFVDNIIAMFITTLGVLSITYIMQSIILYNIKAIDEQDTSELGLPAIQRKIAMIFGKRISGLLSWGYWVSAFVGNLAYYKLLTTMISRLFSLGDRFTIYIDFITLFVIFYTHIISSLGIKYSTKINSVITILKVFILSSILIHTFSYFSIDTFKVNNGMGGIYDFCKSMYYSFSSGTFISPMAEFLWLFIGFEGSIFLGHKSKSIKSLKIANFLGIALVSIIYAMVIMVTFGTVASEECIKWSGQCSLFLLAASKTGTVARIFLKVVPILFLLGAIFSWTIYASELLVSSMRMDYFPISPLISKHKLTIKQENYTASLITTIATQVCYMLSVLLKLDYMKLADISVLAILPIYIFILATYLKTSFNGNIFPVIAIMFSIIYILSIVLSSGFILICYSSIIFIFGILLELFLRFIVKKQII